MYQLLVTGDVPGAATYFNPLVQQTIIPVTSGTRPTPSHEGMTIYETDTNAQARWNGSAWEYQGSSRTTSFVPSLTASTTNPTLGSGSVRLSWWSYLPGGLVQYMFLIKFGTSGANAGSGNYAIDLPVTSTAVNGTTNHSAVGTLLAADSSAGSFRVGTCFPPGGSLGSLGLILENSTIITNAAPWTWAASDYISGSIIYPV